MSRDEAKAAEGYIRHQAAMPAVSGVDLTGRACFKCMYWRADLVPSRHDRTWTGRCEANAPQFLGGEFIPFPQTDYDLWCGQFRAGKHDIGRCGDCAFWCGSGNSGECRVQAPVIDTKPSRLGIKFAHTRKNEGCAAWTDAVAEEPF